MYSTSAHLPDVYSWHVCRYFLRMLRLLRSVRLVKVSMLPCHGV